jgi:hypothetical protein
MTFGSDSEHFVTLFDKAFLLSGLTLHRSLREHIPNSHLWVIALDADVVSQLATLALDGLTVIPLSEIETDELRAVKNGRTRGEYAWTLTSFLPPAVMERVPGVRRVTYIDADLFFFSNAQCLFDELDTAGKSVLITPHAYAPEYDRSFKNGHFCVQFVVFNNDIGARKVLQWWQARCLEWCFARVEDGKYGDQKYLDAWPQLFEHEVWVLAQTNKTLAPWNVDFMQKEGRERPVFYHFQGFRILSAECVKLYHGYRVNRKNYWLYDIYIEEMRDVSRVLARHGIDLVSMPEHGIAMPQLRRAAMRALRKTRLVRLDPRLGQIA